MHDYDISILKYSKPRSSCRKQRCGNYVTVAEHPKYKTHSYCNSCKRNHDFDLINCPDCGFFLRHKPKKGRDKENMGLFEGY